MEHQKFDEWSRLLGTFGSRRSAIATFVGLLGVGRISAEDAEGESKQQRRRHRHRKRKNRRAKGFMRGIKLYVGNSTSAHEIDIELGFETYDTASGYCCQGEAAYKVKPKDFEEYATEETVAYLWVENRYFIDFRNPAVLPANISWAADGVTAGWSKLCCKPQGHEYGNEQSIAVDETLILDFVGRKISVTRLKDSGRYKRFVVEA